MNITNTSKNLQFIIIKVKAQSNNASLTVYFGGKYDEVFLCFNSIHQKSHRISNAYGIRYLSYRYVPHWFSFSVVENRTRVYFLDAEKKWNYLSIGRTFRFYQTGEFDLSIADVTLSLNNGENVRCGIIGPAVYLGQEVRTRLSPYLDLLVSAQLGYCYGYLSSSSNRKYSTQVSIDRLDRFFETRLSFGLQFKF